MRGPRKVIPHQIFCGNSAGTPKSNTPQNFLRKLLRGPRRFTPPSFLRKFGGDPENLTHAKSLRIFRGDPCAEGTLTQLLADLPHRKYFRREPRMKAPPKILSAGTPKIYPTKFPAEIRRGPRMKNTRKKVAGRRPFCMFKMLSRQNSKFCCPPFLWVYHACSRVLSSFLSVLSSAVMSLPAFMRSSSCAAPISGFSTAISPNSPIVPTSCLSGAVSAVLR